WLEFRGKPILPIGDSVTQGWMESGANFDQRAYLDALSARGINVVLLWSYIATSAQSQRQDPRIGYDAPEIWPWKGSPDERNLDLTAFNPAYFERLHEFVQYADSRNIVVVITVQDGWPKTRFACHPLNAALGNGPLTDRRQLVVLADYDKEMPARYHPDWTWQQKNQYFQERFADRLIAELKDCSNVIFEMFNEGEWYEPAQRRLHEEHFLRFFRKRTTAPLATNVDHIRSRDFGARQNPAVDIISLHGKPWTGHFARFEREFKAEPARVVFETEPVPSFSGRDAAPEEAVSLDTLCAAVRERALSGAGWVAQNDASFGWDPESAMAGQANLRDQAYDQIGHAARFFNQEGIEFWKMSPDSKLASTGICLAEPGRAYVVYAPHGGEISVDLSTAAGQMNVKWIDPRTGAKKAAAAAEGGAKRTFACPDDRDWVLHLNREE
ncbi:MAG: putative collagen-binding domain-containing protein, partial [Planctomycetota bacterium]